MEATIQVVLPPCPPAPTRCPRIESAVRGAPANRPPVWVPWIDRSDGNEPGATLPRECDVRPQDPRVGPQAEPT